jgi:SAM-dependent methyltransferase
VTPVTTDLYSTYAHFTEDALAKIRKETFGVDIGQNSWLTVEEYDRFISWLGLTPDDHVLEVASGSGGPALYLADTVGCRVTGIDANAAGVTTASEMAVRSNHGNQVRFSFVDANARLPFDDSSFDAIICIDAMNHLPDRLAVLREWNRVLRSGRRAIFTDPVVISGAVTNDELALRSSIGLFLFVPHDVNERLIAEAGLQLILEEDVTDNAALVAGRWFQARERHKDEMARIEGEERFEGLQRFFAAVHQMSAERRLSRIAYLIEGS